MRYGELKKALVEYYAQNANKSITRIRRGGLINREVYPQVPPKVEYSITEYGKVWNPFLMPCMNGA